MAVTVGMYSFEVMALYGIWDAQAHDVRPPTEGRASRGLSNWDVHLDGKLSLRVPVPAQSVHFIIEELRFPR